MAKRFPYIPEDLLRELDKRFPERVIHPEDRLEQIMYHAGQRSIIRFLQQQSDDSVRTLD